MSAAAAASHDDEDIKSQFEGKDFYAVLGVAKTAALKEIQRGKPLCLLSLSLPYLPLLLAAYRVMALKVHPDRNAGNKVLHFLHSVGWLSFLSLATASRARLSSAQSYRGDSGIPSPSPPLLLVPLSPPTIFSWSLRWTERSRKACTLRPVWRC